MGFTISAIIASKSFATRYLAFTFSFPVIQFSTPKHDRPFKDCAISSVHESNRLHIKCSNGVSDADNQCILGLTVIVF